MTLQTLVTLLITFLGGGSGVWLATEIVKRIKAIPVNEGQAARIRAVAGLFSVLAVVLEGIASGNLVPDNVHQLILSVLTVAGTWITAHLVHANLKE